MHRYLDLDGTQVLVEEINKLIDKNMSDIFVRSDSYLHFPLVGNENKLYIDITEDKLYRWDGTSLKYYPLSDYDSINFIDGRGK